MELLAYAIIMYDPVQLTLPPARLCIVSRCVFARRSVLFFFLRLRARTVFIHGRLFIRVPVAFAPSLFLPAFDWRQ